jgi:pimeloyl-ACP methyl ester carboxylesterase
MHLSNSIANRAVEEPASLGAQPDDMRVLLLILFLFLTVSNLSGKSITSVYLFAGQGSDERIFSKIKFDSSFRVVYIQYSVPEKGATLAEYARTLSSQIDTTGNYIFIGVSMGGMICTELAEFLRPEKIIIISSARCYDELPFRYRFQKAFPLYRIVPRGLMKAGAQMLQPIVEPDRKKNKEVFKSMLKSKSPTYYKRTVGMIINWDRVECDSTIVHIHGTNDHTIPIRNVEANHRIEDGSHMMTLTRGEEMNVLIGSILTRQL